MNLRKHIKHIGCMAKCGLRSRRGSYIVEAAMSLPLFILCIVALALVIRIIAVCENIGFVSAAEIKEIDLTAYKVEGTYPLAKTMLKESVLAENPKLTNFKITKFRYRYSSKDIDDLIGVQSEAVFRVENPVGIHGKISFTQGILTRAFTGTLQDAEPLPESEFKCNAKSLRVVIFPKYGERYHVKSCYYVKRYDEGEAYKLEMEKDDAAAKGYTPCKVCRGGENE